MLAFGGIHVSSQAFSGDHQILIQRVIHFVSSGFGEYVTSGRENHLNFVERAIATR